MTLAKKLLLDFEQLTEEKQREAIDFVVKVLTATERHEKTGEHFPGFLHALTILPITFCCNHGNRLVREVKFAPLLMVLKYAL